jgi:teichuronic acid biosynthesis glycosyltransferase TuaC
VAGSFLGRGREAAAAMSAISQPVSGKKQSPPHVLTLTAFYPSEDDGAGGCFVAEPLDWLARQGIRNSVFAVQPFYRKRNRPAKSSITARWFRYPALPGGFGLPTAGAFAFARIVGPIRELHRRQPIDLIHAQGALPCGHAAMLLSKELGIPYVVSVHGLDAFSTTQVSGRAGQWCRRISQHVYGSSRRVICVSERVREVVIEGMGRTGRTSVVYNGVDTEMFSPAESESKSAHVILSVGNLIPIKGHEILLRSVAALAQDFPDLHLELIGEGPERSHLQALATKLQISDRVKFRGRLPRKEVAAAMRRCTLFVLPSRYEALGCVYLEAMAAGKPVIGCRGQGIADIVQHGLNGFLVGPDNEKELTLAIAMLLNNETLRGNLGRAARDTIVDRLTLENQAETLARIYRESLP